MNRLTALVYYLAVAEVVIYIKKHANLEQHKWITQTMVLSEIRIQM